MKRIINTGRVPIKSWTKDIEEGAIKQAENLSNLPFIYKHVALMPDVHEGYGMPIGGVIATDGVIIPNCVGVDIGCGMCAYKTSFKSISQKNLKKVMSKIRKEIPVGFNKHKRVQDGAKYRIPSDVDCVVAYDEWENALHQLGTLGGGNHFIEIQKGDDGYIWIMIHSGSRNVGKKVADYYNKKAKEMMDKYWIDVPKDLAYLPIETLLAKDYLREMNWCLNFAYENRKLMMERCLESIGENFIEDDMINIHHNYAAIENHFGKNVWVHRKGATSAKEGEIGIIPGSQGTSSYIVRGLGNLESFKSCSHGAGRKMGRKAARENLDLKREKEKLDKQGIVHSIRTKDDLDEASGAYKDINVVMENQKDLVDIVIELKPLGVVKG